MILFYYFYNYNNIINISSNNNMMMKLIYNNINADYLNLYICNYFNNSDITDIYFIYGQCNFKSNYNNNKITDYIFSLITQIDSNPNTRVNTLSYDDFIKLKDSNGNNYYNKIKSAMLTDTILQYFISNNAYNNLARFFSITNTTNTNFLDDIYKYHLNPFVYLSSNNLTFLQSKYTYNESFQTTFHNNSNIFYQLLQDYNNLEYSITNIMVNIYNICSYNMISIYTFYLLLFIIMIIFIIVYFVIIYNKV